MFILESIAQAWHSLKAHKMRTGLTMFGIIWGITSLIILVGMGRSFQKLFYNEFRKVGEKIFVIEAGQPSSGLGGIKGGRPIRFTMDDVRAVQNHCTEVDLVSPQIFAGFLEAKSGSEALLCSTFGVNENAGIIRSLHVERGRFISPDDVESGRRVCVLGATVKEKLFGDRKAAGEFIRLAGIRFKIVGEQKRKGDQLSRFWGLDDNHVSIPYTTAQRLFVGSEYFDEIVMQPHTLGMEPEAREQVRETMAVRHEFAADDPDALDFMGVSDMIGNISGVILGMQVFLGAASIVTLIIGGIGVMNIMFVSINERIREIGIIKAVGATRRQIFQQFLAESIFVTLFAGLVGVLLGCSICLALGSIELPHLVAAPEIDPLVMAIAFSTMTLVGVLSGILPAIKASRMQVAEALRFY